MKTENILPGILLYHRYDGTTAEFAEFCRIAQLLGYTPTKFNGYTNSDLSASEWDIAHSVIPSPTAPMRVDGPKLSEEREMQRRIEEIYNALPNDNEISVYLCQI